jgi:polar amino acid transport system substrate-binding protein
MASTGRPLPSRDRLNRTGRRPFGRLRGWGGITAMAAAIGLTAALTLLPLSRSVGASGPPEEADGAPITTAVPVTADSCQDPERSLRPGSGPVSAVRPIDGHAIQRIKAADRLVVGIDQNSYRWGYRDPATGRIEGFDIDLAHAIAADILGDPDKIIFRAIPTNQRIPALQNGTVDLVVRTMTINCDRIKEVAFSTAYFQAGQQVLAPRESSITGYNSSLKGKRVCTAAGSTANEALKKESFGAIIKDEHDGQASDENQLTVPNQLDCLVRLQLGEVDAVVTDNALAAGQAAQDPGVKLVGKPFTTEFYGVAAKLGNDDLVRRVNKVLVGYRAGGKNSRWMTSYRKWLAAGLPGISGPPAPQYKD